MLKIKRVYDDASPEDGKRILVDRLWPRGMKKEKAAVDEWMKELAPTDELRKWYAHDTSKWTEFRRKYKKELIKQKNYIADIRQDVAKGTVTLLFASKDEKHNNAVVLKEVIEGKS